MEEIKQHDQEITQLKETASLENMVNNEMSTGDIISTIINLSNVSSRNDLLIKQIILYSIKYSQKYCTYLLTSTFS